LWTKTFGGINDDRGNSVQQTTDGGYIVTGYTGSFGAGSTDVYLIKTDVTGDTTWTKTFGGTSGEQGNSVQQSADGGYIIAGTTNSFGVDSIDVYLIRTDATGNSIWTKTFGGTGKEIVYSVRQTTDGGYIIGGITTSFGAGSFDVYLVKTDATGDTSWTRTFGGTSYDGGYSVQQTTDGGYIIGASSVSFGIGGSYDVYLIKTDANGNSGCNEGNTATIVSTPATIVTSPATIVTSPATVVTTPATIVGSGGVVSTLCNSVGIDKINNPIFSISVSPNPASSNSEITFTYPSLASQSEIVLNNIDGKEVARYSLPLSSNAHHVKLPKLAEGIYVARLVGSSFSANVKFVIY
jgi:hypothetical protein